LPSALHVITGPSRTSDIENDLTIGVHGPASVVVILLRGSG
jgi:L-lactate dehydrogenase complex protein LldG